MHVSLSDIHQLIGGNIIGNSQTMIHTLSSIEEVEPQSLIFVESANYHEKAIQSQAAAILVPEEITSLGDKPLIQVKRPMLAFMQLLAHFYPNPVFAPGIHATAVYDESAQIHATTHIAPRVTIGKNCCIEEGVILLTGVVIGDNVTIGKNSKLHPNVVIYDHTKIGENVVLHAGTVVGCDGFGYRFHEGRHQKVPHIGRVIIENNVEIGANTVIDRASLGTTSIGEGTKIDNLVQIAHSVKIGAHNIICSMTGVAGSSKTGKYVTLAANVGVSDHVTIEDNVTLGARTGVAPNKILRKDTVWLGAPARPQEKTIEQIVALQKLPDLFEKVRELKTKVKALENQLENNKGDN